MLNLDTHILVKALQGLLTPRERVILKNDSAWCISGIVLWEISKLHQIGRLNFGLEYEPLAAALEKLDIIPVNHQVCRSLSSLDFQSDPADEIIGATSLAYQIPLVTRDSRILASRIIKFA
jgi:PIN domain nuclease of toxin-antitoxin system